MVKNAAKKDEQVLFYQFSDMDKLTAIREVLDKLHIRSQLVPEAGYRQKVGYLLGLKGFSAVQPQDDDDFVFPHEVMILHNIKNKRLDMVLTAMGEAKIPPVRFKAVVTPFNTLWTLRRLCETMQKEHAAMVTGKDDKKDE